jgi:MraZ protein
MANFIGEYTCKIEAKGRLLFPSAFKKQLGASNQDRFVIKKEIFEPCLTLYPIEEWERQNELIKSKINPYNKEHNKFLREFYKGTAEVLLDQTNRLLIPRSLLEYAQIKKDVVLAGQNEKIEIWAKELFDKNSMSSDEFASLAENILGKNNNL